MACVNLVFPSQKLNSNGTLQRDTRGFNAGFSQKIPSVSVVQFTVQMFKLNGPGKTHRERMFVVELKLKLRSLFHCEQIAWENSGINWMKVPSFSFQLWTIKINCRRVLGRLSTKVMTLLFIQIHSETNIFLWTKAIWVREKRRFISYSSALGGDRRVCLKYCPADPLTKALPWLVGRDRKIMTVQNQSDCKIRYRALSKKCSYLTTKRYTNYKNFLNYALKRMFPKRPTGTRYLTLFLCHQLL